MARKPTPRFDYDYLLGLQDDNAPKEVFLLDEAAQQVLSQLADVVLWPTRWDNANEDDPDFVQFRGAIYEALKVPVHFDDLLPLLDDIEPLLRAIRDAQCCGPDSITGTTVGGGQVQFMGDDNAVPDSPYDAFVNLPPDYATDATGATPFTESGWLDYYCGALHWFLDYLLLMLKWALFLRRVNRGVWDVIRWILNRIAGSFYPGFEDDAVIVALSAAEELINDVWDDLQEQHLQDAIDAIEANYDDIICAFYGGISWQQIVAVAPSILAGFGLPAATITFMTLTGFGAALAYIWNGLVNDEAWRDSDCSACGGPPAALAVWSFDVDHEGWAHAGGDAAWLSDDGYPDVGCVNLFAAGSQRVYHSPDFEFAGGTGTVRISLYYRSANGANWISGFGLIGPGDVSIGFTRPERQGEWTFYQEEVTTTWPAGMYRVRVIASGLSQARFDSVEVRSILT